MMSRGQRLLALSALSVGLGACASILGIEDGILDTPPVEAGLDVVVPVEAGDEPSVDAGLDAPMDTAPPEDVADVKIDRAPSCIPDASESVDEGAGVFVSIDSEDRNDCGALLTPCKTIQKGIDRAIALGNKDHVYVASGEYVESLTLRPGLTIEGGWEILGAWRRNCTDTPQAAVLIQAPANRNVTVTAAYNGTTTLRLLTIKSKDPAASGESLYGVMATGATTELTLDRVALEIARGGDGVDGPPGDPGAPGITGCPPGDAGVGANSTATGAGAAPGAFNDTGYVPRNASATGGPGGLGRAGGAGTDGGCSPPCGSCGGLGSCAFSANGTASCGTGGKAGCPGAGGTGGGPGTGAGSSVGVFATTASVTVTRSTITTAGGGAGGAGGPGGSGGSGGPPAAGAPPAAGCVVSCPNAGLGCTTASATGTAGQAGTMGGPGGTGAAGGGGAGGHSYGVVVTGPDASVVQVPSTTFQVGPAGTSRGNGAPGAKGDRSP